MAGYSGTPLVKKLGIKENVAAAFVNAPAGFLDELGLPVGVDLKAKRGRPLDFILFFTKSARELDTRFESYAQRLSPPGMFWVAWPKKAAKVATDLNENLVREIGLAKGMVDVKVCAVDDVWSGLKFVFRLRDRGKIKSRRDR